MGCPRCSSNNITQKKHATAVGWVLFILGVGGACFTYGGTLLLCLLSLFFTEYRANCKQCGWKWK